MRDTELISTMKPVNLDMVAMETATSIMELVTQPLPYGAVIQRLAQVQELVREAIAGYPQSALAVYWYNRFQELSATAGQLRKSLAKADYEIAQLREVKDGAYEERNMVVAALAKCFPSGIGKTVIEGWDPAWHNCVYIDLPTGQASWHYHDDHAHLFASLPEYPYYWDKHTTPVKYDRLAAIKPTWTEAPARTVVMTFYHPTIGDGQFTPLMNEAMSHIIKTDPKGEVDEYRMPSGVVVKAENKTAAWFKGDKL